MKNELHSDDNDEYVSDDEYKLVAIDDEVSKIMCMSFVNIDNDQFYGLISKISKSAKKGSFLTFFKFLVDVWKLRMIRTDDEVGSSDEDDQHKVTI